MPRRRARPGLTPSTTAAAPARRPGTSPASTPAPPDDRLVGRASPGDREGPCLITAFLAILRSAGSQPRESQMSSRTARTMIAYPQPDQPVELKTRGSYSHAGLVFQQDGSWEMAAHGTSPRSVERRAKASAGRQYAGRAQALVNS